MTKILNFDLKIKEGGREGGTCEVLRPCHPPSKKKLERAQITEYSIHSKQDKKKSSFTSQ